MFVNILKFAVVLLVDLTAVTTLAVMVNKKSKLAKYLAVMTVVDALFVSVLMLIGFSWFVWVKIW